MEIQKLLICQFGDKLRISARLICIGRIREKGIQDYPVQHSLRRGKRPLHLVVNNTVVFQVRIRAVQFITPALLAEDFFVLVDIWIEYRIHIYMHQILEILVIAARNRINRLVRIGHGIQKSVQGTFHQFYERVLNREVPGTA